MKTTESQQWLHLIVFTLAGIAVFGMFYLMAVAFIQPARDVRDYYAGVVAFTEESIPGYTPVAVPPPGEVYRDFFALKTGDKVRIGDYLVIYRGRQSGGRFKLEVANTQLDTQSFYNYSFETGKAAEPIRIGSQRFRVLSARSTILHLQRITE
jgi:hypothetical protein